MSTPLKLRPLPSPAGASPVSFPVKPALSSASKTRARPSLQIREDAGVEERPASSFLAALSDGNAAAKSAILAADRLLQKSAKKTAKMSSGARKRVPLQSLAAQNSSTPVKSTGGLSSSQPQQQQQQQQQQQSLPRSSLTGSLPSPVGLHPLRRRSLSTKKLKPMPRDAQLPAAAVAHSALEIFEPSPKAASASASSALSSSSSLTTLPPTTTSLEPSSSAAAEAAPPAAALVEPSEKSHDSLLLLRRSIKAWRGATDDAILGSPFAKFVKACAHEPGERAEPPSMPEHKSSFSSSAVAASANATASSEQPVLSSPSRDTATATAATTTATTVAQRSGRTAATPPPAYGNSHKKRRVSSARKRAPPAIPFAPTAAPPSMPAAPAPSAAAAAAATTTTTTTTTTSSSSSDVATFLANLFPEELSMTASAFHHNHSDSFPQPSHSSHENNINATNKSTMKKKKPAALALPAGSGKVDPSPVKKRRIVDAGFDEDPDVTDFARQLRGGARVAQTVAVPTPVFGESKTSASLFGAAAENARTQSAFVYPPPTTTAVEDARTAAKQQKMAQPSSHHTLAPVPPLSETDRRYKTALIGFETSMKDDPSSHATDVALQSVVDLLHGSEVLGDPSLGGDGGNNDGAPEDSDAAELQRAAELRTAQIVQAMAQLCREQDAFDQAHGSSMLRWKVSYGAKNKKKIEEAEGEAQQPAKASVA